MDKNEAQEVKEQIKGVLYEESKMQQVINILNTIPVNGLVNIKNMSIVFDVLSDPILFKSTDEE